MKAAGRAADGHATSCHAPWRRTHRPTPPDQRNTVRRKAPDQRNTVRRQAGGSGYGVRLAVAGRKKLIPMPMNRWFRKRWSSSETARSASKSSPDGLSWNR